MNDTAFADSPAEKLMMVTGAIQRAIGELQDMAKADTAYIALIAFGKTASLVKDSNGAPFFKSVSTIISEYGPKAQGLPDYLYPYFKDDAGKVGRDETDITDALSLARQITDCMIRGDLTPVGVRVPAKLMEHTDIFTRDGKQISVPNVRVMIYSDGAHGSNRHAQLQNAFADLDPSPLMTAFIGDPDVSPAMKEGAAEMQKLANTCPEHGIKGFFLIDAPSRYAVLRNLFRMASGASGFCEECLKRDVKSFESVR